MRDCAARSDLRDIADYIARDNPDRAESFAGELLAKIAAIGERPLLYPLRQDGRRGLRSALHRDYLIFFRIEGDVVTILRVIHGARGVGSLF